MSEKKVYLSTYCALMALLALTFALAHARLGPLNLALSLLIALIKAWLVVVFFMHLKRSDGVHRLAAALGVVWLMFLLVLSLSDYASRGWMSLPGDWPANSWPEK